MLSRDPMPPKARWALVGFAAAWFSLGLNPWVVPGHYDSLLYHSTATELAQGNGFVYAGELVGDWPPGAALLLALFRLVGTTTLLADKIVILGTAMISLVLLTRLLEAEKRVGTAFVVLAVILSPISLRHATSPMSEWPYMMASFCFLWGLEAEWHRRTWVQAAALGLLLGAAALTRYVGIFLGAAVLFAFVRHTRKCGIRTAFLTEGVVGAVGAGLFVAWQVYLQASSLPRMEAVNLSRETYSSFHPSAVLVAVSNVVSAAPMVLGRLFGEGVVGEGAVGDGALGPSVLIPSALVGLLVVFAIIQGVRQRRLRSSDAYVVALLVFLCFYERGELAHHSRYLLPISPFLIASLVELGADVAEGFRRWRVSVLAPGALVLSVFALGSGLLVFRGTENHTGLGFWNARNATQFYRGDWADLLAASRSLGSLDFSGPGCARLEGDGPWKFVRYFAKREICAPNESEARFLLTAGREPVGGRWAPVGRFGRYRTYTVHGGATSRPLGAEIAE